MKFMSRDSDKDNVHSPVLIEQPGAAQSPKLDGSGLHIAIVASRWFDKAVHPLVAACSNELLSKGVADTNLHLVEVNGAFELPFAAARLVHRKDTSHRPDAVICIGCIVNDATHMCDIMSQAVANGIMKLNVTSDTPVIYGVLCCENESQAHACAEKRSSSGGHECNHGVAWAQSALEMAHLKRCTSSKQDKQCHCVRCESREGESSKQKTDKHATKEDLCTTCGMSAEKCSCDDCKCQGCCGKRGVCAECKCSAENCSCKDCKCRSCCTKRDACRGCGCPSDKCTCKDCNCAVCGAKKAEKKPLSEFTTPESEKVKSSAHMDEEKSAVPTGVSAAKCPSCGKEECKCGLLH